MGDAFEETDLRMGIADGGQVLGAFIVARSEEDFVVYLRCNWVRFREFRIIRTYRGASGDRSFKNLQTAWSFIRRFGFTSQITIYPAGHADLREFSGLAERDSAECCPTPLPCAGTSPPETLVIGDRDSRPR